MAKATQNDRAIMQAKSTGDPADGVADVDNVGDGASIESGTGGCDSGPIIYLNRSEFLIASVSDGRQAWDDGKEEPEYYGLAKTEHQFRQALCDMAFPTVRKLSKQKMQAMMADELKLMACK